MSDAFQVEFNENITKEVEGVLDKHKKGSLSHIARDGDFESLQILSSYIKSLPNFETSGVFKLEAMSQKALEESFQSEKFDERIFDLLLENGAEVDNNVRLISLKSPSAIKCLHSRGMLNVDSLEGKLPLALALRNGLFDSADTLMELGADINATEFEMFGGYTALHYAVQEANFMNSLWLLERGASVSVDDFSGSACFQYIEDESDSQWEYDKFFELMSELDKNPNSEEVREDLVSFTREKAYLEFTPISGNNMMEMMKIAAVEMKKNRERVQKEEDMNARVAIKPKAKSF